MVRILYFAWVRERIGLDGEDVTLTGCDTTAGDLLSQLRTRSAAHAAALAEQERLRVAVGQSMADWDTPVRDGDEVAFFPPVTGG